MSDIGDFSFHHLTGRYAAARRGEKNNLLNQQNQFMQNKNQFLRLAKTGFISLEKRGPLLSAIGDPRSKLT